MLDMDMYTKVLQNPLHNPPLHETYGMGVEVFIRVDRPWHEQCPGHYFDAANRMGDASCLQCGVTGWAAAWVRVGVMGDNTHEFLRTTEDLHRASVPMSVEAIAEALGGEVIDVLSDHDLLGLGYEVGASYRIWTGGVDTILGYDATGYVHVRDEEGRERKHLTNIECGPHRKVETPVQNLVVHLDVSEPAKTKRAGLPVPPMKFMDFSVPE